MIQRKQTLFLAIAALLCLATWFFPVSTYDHEGGRFVFSTRGLFGPDGAKVEEAVVKVPFHAVLSVLGGAFLVAVVLYRDRSRQLRVVRATYLITLAVIAFVFITDNAIRAYIGQGGGPEHRYGFSYFAPLLVLVFAFLAERAIRADEELVRSMDRLR